MNYFKTFLLMTGLLALMMIVGGLLTGTPEGMFLFFLIGLGINFFSYWYSDKIVLKMYGAKETTEKELPEVYRIVRNLTQKTNLPMPKIYIMHSPMPNAFATGRNPEHAAVAVTSGILNLLDEKELTGVLGHELAHVKNRDILISTIAAAIAGAIMTVSRMAMWSSMLGDRRERSGGGHPLIMIALMILAPVAAMIIQMAISRSREYGADETGSEISGMPLALASALKKLQAGVQKNPAEVNSATAHLFIVSPLSGESLMSLFSTHPPIPERVKRLEKIAEQMMPGLSAKLNIPKIIY